MQDNEIIRSEPSDAMINEELCERVDYVVEDSLLHDETFKYRKEEMRDLSEMYRIAMNMDKKQLAVFVCAALDKYTFMVFQNVAEFVINLLNERGRK